MSQFEASDPVDVARKWVELLLSDRPIRRASGYIARSVLHDLSIDPLPVQLDGLTNAWQLGGSVGTNFYCATIVKTA